MLAAKTLVCVCVCVCVCVRAGGGAIFGPMYESWVLITHGIKSALKTVYVLVERLWVLALNRHSMYCIGHVFVEVAALPWAAPLLMVFTLPNIGSWYVKE